MPAATPQALLPQPLSSQAPSPPPTQPRYADIAVTAFAAEFQGIYRGKQQHAPDFPHVLRRARAANVRKVLLTGMSLADVELNTAIAEAHPDMCGLTVGMHPYHAAEVDSDGTYLGRLAGAVDGLLGTGGKQPQLIRAFGELGLDYDRLNRAGREVQVRAFRAQLDLFVEKGWDLPLFLHCRAAFEDFVAIMQEYVTRLPRGGVVHSFVGTVEQMKTLVAMGLDVSVNGFSFQDAESLRMVGEVPLERLQIETDAPWGEVKDGDEVWKWYGNHYDAAVEPKRKKKDKWEDGCMIKERNESCCIGRVAFVVAGYQGRSVEEVADASWKNSMRMFWWDEADGKS